MKKNLHFLFFILFTCTSSILNAQLADGSIAPDWTLTDINGDTYNLYDELDAGKSIILDISATWCGPCWTYHNSGIMEAIYDDFGPDGTDQVRVFMVEGESDTNLDCLYGTSGCNDSSWGDWVTGTNYPIFSPDPAAANSFVSSYQLGFWPTVYGISPIDKTTTLVGQASYDVWESWLIDSWQMSGSVDVQDSDCPYTGEADLEVELGFGSLDYQWSNGATTEDLVDAPAGNYSVTVTDDHNVDIVIEDIVIGGTSAPIIEVAYFDIVDIDCNGNSTGALDVFAFGGAGSFTYDWDNGMVGGFIDNLTGGDYQVTATDATGCEAVQIFTVGEPEELTLDVVATSTVCGEDNGSALIFPYGGVSPYTYDIGMGTQNSSSFNSLPAGTYTSEITDANGCITQQAFDIGESAATVAVAEANGDIDCNTTSVVVSGANSTSSGNLRYLWSTNDGEITGDNEQESITVSVEGTYSLKVTEIGTGCFSTSHALVANNTSEPTIALMASDMITCSANQVIIDGTMSDTGANLSYSWTTMDGNIVGESNSLILNVDQGGTYTLNVSDVESGCFAEESITIEEDTQVPTIEVTNEVLTCVSSEVEICATVESGDAVSWMINGEELNQTCITVSSVGEYIARVTSSNGCENSAVASVTASNDLPVVSISVENEITCTQETVQIESNIQDQSNDDVLTWSDANGNTIGSGEESIMVSEPGIYQLSVTNASGCTTTETITVEENINTPAAAFTYSLDNEGVVILNSDSEESGSVTWSLADGTILTGNEATFSLLQGGEYEVCMTYTNECGSDENCQTIVYSTALAVSIEKTNLTCYQSADGAIVPTVSGGASGYTFYWIGSNGFESTEANLTALSAGIYTLVINDQSGSELSTEVIISEPQELISNNDQVINVNCFGEQNGSLTINMEGGTGMYSYLWSDGNMESNRSDLGAGDYSLMVTDENGCQFSQLYTIQEPQLLTVASVITTEETDELLNGEIEIEIMGGTGEVTFEWSNGATTASINNLAAGEYSVVITDANGCSHIEDGIIVGTLTDVADLDIVDDFSLYPVPAFTFLNVESTLSSTQSVRLNILDSTGKSVWSRAYSTSKIDEEIDLTSFPAGIYTLTMVAGNSIESDNFMVIK